MFGVGVSVVHSAAQSNLRRLASPTFSLPGGSYVGTRNISLAVTDGAQIRYTTNGTTPTAASTLYAGAIAVAVGTTTIKAIGIKSGANTSQVASATFVIS